MTGQQQVAVEEITLMALSLRQAEREAYLHRQAGGDVEILTEVRRRLDLAAQVPNYFLDQPLECVDGSDSVTLPWSGDGPAEQLVPTAELGELLFAVGQRYQMIEVLGAGGMAVVFRAFDRRLERPVAIKHLRRGLAEDPQAMRCFEREARAAAKVSHPAVVEIFDVLNDGGDLWIVMELVPGRSLASRLAEGPLELAEALSLATDIANGLAAAHAVGIVHLDLKAANVMVTPAGYASAGRASAGRASAGRASAGRAKILDFGLATSLCEDGRTAGGGLRGTPIAMSPEQVSRLPVDSRSDLFSFGALLYQMVTNVSPFAGSSPLITLERVCRFRPPPTRQLDPRVSEELSALIEALLEKDPSRRLGDTAAVARTLKRLAESTTAARVCHCALHDAEDVALPSVSAERRHVTVLSCQLVAAGCSARLLESEELFELEGPFRELAMPIIERFGAWLETWVDGGFRVCFGFPRAQEDDAERAVAAALELVAAVGRWSAGSRGGAAARICLRVGINSGPILVTTRSDGKREVLLGRTGCCATEMKVPAPAAGAILSAVTHHLLGGIWRCESLGMCPLGRCQAPFELFRVLARNPGGGADCAGCADVGLPPFLGRQAELAVLRRHWRQAATGRGQVVVLRGDAGIGKSRLVEEFHRLVGAVPGIWTAVSCRPLPAPAPSVGWLSRALGCASEEEQTLLVSRLARSAHGETAVLVIEDIHLAGPADLELLGLLIDEVPAARLLLLLTCRAPFDLPWQSVDLSVCELGPLNARQVRDMVRHLAAGRALATSARLRILAAADGIPRFVEELTRAMLSGEDLGEEVPAALRSGLMARLDSLGSAREVARVASVLGREFTREQLAALLPSAEDAIERGLERLVEAQYLQHSGDRLAGTYRFRLALDCAAARESLLGEHRRLYEQRAVARPGLPQAW